LPAVFVAYRAPADGTKDSYAMNLLVQILSGGKSARLKTNLDEKGLTAQSVLMYLGLEDSGMVYALGVANLGKESGDVEDAIIAEIEKISSELVSEDEFQMALAAVEYSTAARLRTLAGVSEALASNYTYFKDTNLINKELSFYSELTREDLLRVAQKYFQPQSKIVVYYLPKTN